MAGRAASRARADGRHLLRSSAVADWLVRAADVAPGELALDVGAGTGFITHALVRAGAHVVAVERDAALARALARRAGTADVVVADAATMALPREPFVVVSNLPFGSGTAILRRLLDPRTLLERAVVVVAWGLAGKRTALRPSTLLGVYWGAWHRLELVRRLPASAFAPRPSVDAGVLRTSRRTEPLVDVADAGRYRRFLELGYARGPGRIVASHTLRQLAHQHGLDPRARPGDLDAEQWSALFHAAVRAGR